MLRSQFSYRQWQIVSFPWDEFVPNQFLPDLALCEIQALRDLADLLRAFVPCVSD
jgi:hypothetical protein